MLFSRFCLPYFHWHGNCSVHAAIHFCDSMWSLRVEANLCWYSIVCLYMYFRLRSRYQVGEVGIPITFLFPDPGQDLDF